MCVCVCVFLSLIMHTQRHKHAQTRTQVDGRTVNLGAKAIVNVQGGDRIRILTPGGGGYGVPHGAHKEKGHHVDDRDGGKQLGGHAEGEWSAPVRMSGSVMQYKAQQESA